MTFHSILFIAAALLSFYCCLSSCWEDFLSVLILMTVVTRRGSLPNQYPACYMKTSKGNLSFFYPAFGKKNCFHWSYTLNKVIIIVDAVNNTRTGIRSRKKHFRHYVFLNNQMDFPIAFLSNMANLYNQWNISMECQGYYMKLSHRKMEFH